MKRELTSPGPMRASNSLLCHQSQLKKSKPHDLQIDKGWPRLHACHKRASHLADMRSDPGRRDRALGRRQCANTEEHHNTRFFACPFYRRSPTSHMECMNRKLTRIRDVKQHIHRKHSQSQSPYNASNSHVISAETERELRRHRAGRTETAVTEWKNVWRIVFGDESQPGEPYLGTTVEETVHMIHDFWKSEGSQITEQFLKEKGAGADDTFQIMSELFKVAHDRFKRSTLGRRSGDFSVAELPNSSSLIESQSPPLYHNVADSVSSSVDLSSIPWGMDASVTSDVSNLGGAGSWVNVNALSEWNPNPCQETEEGWNMVGDDEGAYYAGNGIPLQGFEFSSFSFETDLTC